MPVAGPVLPALNHTVGIRSDAHSRIKVTGQTCRDGNRVVVHRDRRRGRGADLTQAIRDLDRDIILP